MIKLDVQNDEGQKGNDGVFIVMFQLEQKVIKLKGEIKNLISV